ncbi:helix-turn-helix domain-containing protein [Roseobacteraceae bacterium S113]
MYAPKGHGKDRAFDAVHFAEADPPPALAGIVHRFLELRTTRDLDQDYRFHALPDACTYVIFDQSDPEITGVTRLSAQAEELNLGRAFHFVNIRFLPGVWQNAQSHLRYGAVETGYDGPLPLLESARRLQGQDFEAQVAHLIKLVERLVADEIVAPNPVVNELLLRMDDILSVADMAEIAGLSARQLQRVLKSTTGFSPHDFLKILRLQQSLEGTPSLGYADQSHFIHSFRRATGYTPGKHAKKFDV